METLLDPSSVPERLREALKPPPDLAVSSFLHLASPKDSLRSTEIVKINTLHDWYSRDEPTESPQYVTHIHLGKPKMCLYLADTLDDALKNGYRSVLHPYREGCKLPLWIASAFRWGHAMKTKQILWEDRQRWAENAAQREKWPVDFEDTLQEALGRCPWMGGLPGLQRGAVGSANGFGMLLSNDWLTDDVVNCMLDVVRADQRQADGLSSSRCVADSSLGQAIEQNPSGGTATFWGKRLESRQIHQIYFPMNVANLHWIAVGIDVPLATINFGDSYPMITKTHLPAIIDKIKAWLRTFVEGVNWRINLNGLAAPLQQDTTSCGIVSVNTIHRAIYADARTWAPDQAQWARAHYFIRCVETGHAEQIQEEKGELPAPDVRTSSLSPSADPEVLADSGPAQAALEERAETYERLENESEVAKEKKLTRPVKTSDDTDVDGSWSENVDSDEDTASGSELVDSDADDAELARNDVMREDRAYIRFQRKVLALDPKATFDHKDPYRVRCSRCGKWATSKRDNDIERFKVHRGGVRCQEASGVPLPITSFFKRVDNSLGPNLQSLPCPGLTHNDDPRIVIYLRRTTMPNGGAPARHILAAQIQNGRAKVEEDELMKLILLEERHQAKWLNNHMSGSVFSPLCDKRGFVSGTGLVRACTPCAQVLRIKLFRNAIRRPMPTNSLSKHVPKTYRNPLLGEAYQRHSDVRELMEMGDSRWLTFAKRGAAGRYKDLNALIGLMEAIMVVEDKGVRGVQLKNIKYSEDFDNFCTTLAAISPSAYQAFRAEFAGRTLTSMRAIRAKKPRFIPGIVDVNFERLVMHMDQIGCRDTPVSLSVDDTLLHPAMRPYYDGGDDCWKLAGIHGCVPSFGDYAELRQKVSADQQNLADKVRVWLVGFPVAGIPSFPIAIMPLKSTVTQQELRGWHDEIEARLQRCNIAQVSYTPDGASTERRLEHQIIEEAIRDGRTRSWSYQLPQRLRLGDADSQITVVAPLLANGKPRVLGSDGKHSKKNGRGAIVSGARTLALGNSVAHFGQLKKIVDAPDSPLLQADILGRDKQDDRAAARTFSSAVLDHISQNQPTEIGLAVYLFVIGELIDAQQSRNMPHSVRMKLLWRGRFFLDRWFKSIVSHPHYSTDTHFISRELYDIYNLFIDSILGLILIHRDYYPRIPLLPWLHSTECCEHFFGCVRKINKDFNLLDLIYMMPKLTLLIDRDAHNGSKQFAKASAHREGYHHMWHDTEGMDYTVLATYPSDDEITSEILPTAFAEAKQLLEVIGVDYTSPTIGFGASTSDEYLRQFRDTAMQAAGLGLGALDSGSDVLEDLEGVIGQLKLAQDHSQDDAEGDGAGRKLDTLLLKESLADMRDTRTDDMIINLGVAATATALHEAQTIEELPEAGADEYLRWQDSVRDCFEKLQAYMDQQEKQSALSSRANPLLTVLPHARQLPLQLVSGGGLNFRLLVSERQAHETSEARAAITWRYRNSSGPSLLATSEQQDETSLAPDTTPLHAESRKLKAKIVNEIVRVQTAFEASKKRTGTGVERAVRWMGQAKRELAHDSSELPTTPSSGLAKSGIGNTTSAGRSRRAAAYEGLTQFLPWRFTDAGISINHPLRSGSMVLVAQGGNVFLGIVLVVYEKGGDKHISHNYVERCASVDRLSRFVAQAYVPYGTFYSPLAATPAGASHQVASYLYAHAESLILSLDSMCPTPITANFPAGLGLAMFHPSADLVSVIGAAHPFRAEFCTITDNLRKAARQRGKRKSAPPDGSTGVAAKRSKE